MGFWPRFTRFTEHGNITMQVGHTYGLNGQDAFEGPYWIIFGQKIIFLYVYDQCWSLLSF